MIRVRRAWRSPPSLLYDRKSPVGRFLFVLAAPTYERADERLCKLDDRLDLASDLAPWEFAIVMLRNAGTISADEYIYFMQRFDEHLEAEFAQTDPLLIRLAKKKRSIKRRHGLDEEDEFEFEPPKYEALITRYADHCTALILAHWRAAGAHEAADLYLRSTEEFADAAERGHEAFWGRWPAESTDEGPELMPSNPSR